MKNDEAEIQSDVCRLDELWQVQWVSYNKLKVLDIFEIFKEFYFKLDKFELLHEYK
jgi:hypothetical protein